MVSLKLAALAAAVVSLAAAVNITVSSEGGNATSPHQYGFLHEDINYSGDGGLYAELINNRAFQGSAVYPVTLAHWYPINGAALSLQNLSEPLSTALPISMNVAAGKANSSVDSCNQSKTIIGFYNDGYFGMDVKIKKYTGSFWVKGGYDGVFEASLQSNITGEVFGSTTVKSMSTSLEWIEHQFELTPEKDAPNSNNTFAITFDAGGIEDNSLDFNLISLFPPTYKGRKNGIRVDLAEVLEEFHPTLFRFPGGNMLEGLTKNTWWDWKNTIGPLKDRPEFDGVWGYPQTNGLGLMEYLYLAEDMGMEPIVAVYGGMALDGSVTPQDELQYFIDDALNEIEFIRGPATSKWGSVRASLGHSEPFKLQYVEVGNEDWLAGGAEGWATYMKYRFPMFLEAISTAYPDIEVISSGSVFDNYTIPEPGAGDYHIYGTPDSMVEQYDLFDNVTIPHIIGEAAAVHPNGGTDWDGGLMEYPWWGGAIGEAVSLIGYERNANKIIGACYAPIIRSLDSWAWASTMVQFAADPALTTKSTSWYIWELFAGHLMTHTLTSTADFIPLYYVTGKNEDTGAYIFKGAVYNSTNEADIPVSLSFDGVEAGTEAELTILTGPENPYGYNDPFTGVNVVKTTKEKVVASEDGVFEFSLPNMSFSVLNTGSSALSKRSEMRHGQRG
ncbi:alpha-L-arabinofuranosidase [Pseudomassariella vexata]|uniref:non-reducing end alpha-L-arabinofuranosidase n=1 Tax=Pseudomassariella vexata TaxID=1141098 RepID=A0A1Y2DUY7_9PEZI|nr:alpha-L-arabinofuranosidase [Pseudomassariella vexata]ORY62465.1 alpha-L-arabinofuranosidase [Pseudomassariella vexata]